MPQWLEQGIESQEISPSLSLISCAILVNYMASLCLTSPTCKFIVPPITVGEHLPHRMDTSSDIQEQEFMVCLVILPGCKKFCVGDK